MLAFTDTSSDATASSASRRPGSVGESPSDGDALTLAAGQRFRQDRAGGRETDERQQLVAPGLDSDLCV